ncbi:MAG: hypothetical protein AAB285_05560, partial [candidate division NC10 bacterium]
DLHKRFDDLRADMFTRFTAGDRRIDDLRAEMNQRFAEVNERFGELRTDMNQRFADVNQRFSDLNLRLTDMHGTLRSFIWVVSGWFTFLTAVLAVFGFLRR